MADSPNHDNHPEVTSHNARYGLILFAVYVLLYAGFMTLSAFAPKLMAATPFGGVNLAILYGLALILAALILAMIYMRLARSSPRP